MRRKGGYAAPRPEFRFPFPSSDAESVSLDWSFENNLGGIGVLRLLGVWLHPWDVLGLRILHRRSPEGERRSRDGFFRTPGPSPHTGRKRRQILDG